MPQVIDDSVLEKLRQALAKRRAQLPSVDEVVDGAENFGRGAMKGLADSGYGLAQGVGSLTGLDGLRDAAIRGKEEAKQFYNPQGRSGIAGDIVGRVLGEGATSMAGGGLAAKGLTAMGGVAAKAAALGGSGLLPTVARNTVLAAPVDVSLSSARAQDAGESEGKTILKDLAMNAGGGALLGGLAHGADKLLPKTALAELNSPLQRMRHGVDNLMERIRPTEPLKLKPGKYEGAKTDIDLNKINEVEQVHPMANKLVAEGATPESIEAGMSNHPLAKRIAARVKVLNNRKIVKLDETPDISDVTGMPLGSKTVTYQVGDQPVRMTISDKRVGGRINVDVMDIDPAKQGTLDPIGVRNMLKTAMEDEGATGIASWRRRDGRVITMDKPGHTQAIPAMKASDEARVLKELGLDKADKSVQNSYLSEYMSGVYLQGDHPNVVKKQLQNILDRNAAERLEGLPVIDPYAPIEKPKPFVPKELPPIPSVGPSTPKIKDFDKLPRLDIEGADTQLKAATQRELMRQYLSTIRTRNLLATRIDPEGVAQYVGQTRARAANLKEYDAGRMRRSMELDDAMLTTPDGLPITPEMRAAGNTDVEVQRALAEAELASSRVRDGVSDPYDAHNAYDARNAPDFDRMSPRGRYDFLEALKRSSVGMDAVGGLDRGPVTWQVADKTRKTPLKQVARDASKAASTMKEIESLNPAHDVGNTGLLNNQQLQILLRKIIRQSNQK